MANKTAQRKKKKRERERDKQENRKERKIPLLPVDANSLRP